MSTWPAVIVTAAMAVLGIQTPSQAAAPSAARVTAATTADADAHAPYEAACGAAKKGEATCYALRRTDVKPSKGLRTQAAPHAAS